MDYSDSLINQIKQFEGFRAHAYPDYKQYSVGWGSHATSPNQTVTPDQAEAMLRSELDAKAAPIDAAAQQYGMTLNQPQREALISFSYNTGAGPRVIQRAYGDPEAIPALMKEYVHVTNSDGSKSVLPALVNRRNMEASLFQGNTTPGPIKPIMAQPVQGTSENAPVASVPDRQFPVPVLSPLMTPDALTLPKVQTQPIQITPVQRVTKTPQKRKLLSDNLPDLFSADA
jgi:GH24 family phage-related lysozyme (muramidase)